MDSIPPFLDDTDVRSIVRLLGEVATSGEDQGSRKRQLMDSLCKLTGANCWGWSLGCGLKAGEHPTYLSMAYGGLDEERYARLVCAAAHADMARMSFQLLAEMESRQGHVTRRHQQFLVEREYRASGIYPLMCAADLGPFLVSLRPLDADTVSTVVLYRRVGEPDFSERESRIAHIVLTEVSGLHEHGWPEDRGATVPRLTPRARLVLNLLLDGHSRKDIAARLEVAENTVAGYQKTIYRHFHVNSHAALMRRFRMGDGGDK
jgi:DNA-binding CsgD family transcriptional regulator